MNYSNPACCIKSCDQTACYVFDSMSYDELNTFWIVSKINFRLLNNEEQPSQNICFCKPHYDQVLLISQCELCGNRSMDMVTLQDNVRECQLILNEDNIPITIKCGILICKPCKLYTLLRNDKTIKITCELQKHIDAVITRIKNKNISITNGLEGIQLAKNEINIKKKEESNQLIMVKFLTQYISNFFTADSSIPSQLVSSVLNLDAIRTPPLLVSAEVLKVMETFTVPITVSIETGLRIEKLMAVLTKDKWDAKFTMENSTALTLNRKKKRTFLDENSSVPRTKKPKIRSVKPTTHVDKATIADYKSLYNNSPVLELALRPYHPVVDNKYEETLKTYSRIKKPTDMSTIQLHQNTFNSQSMPPPNEFPELSRKRAGPTTLSPTTSGKKQLFEYPNISIDKPTVADYKSLYNNSPVLELALRPYHPVVDNKYEKTLKTYSRIKKPTDVSTIQLHQNTFNSQSMPPPNEFPELSRKRAGPTTLSPTTSGMKQLSKNPNISVDKPTIADHKPLYNKSLVSTNRTRSTSSRTEFPELSRQRTGPTTLSSTMPDMIQLFENLKIPYSNEMDFLTHLINLETCRSLGTLTVGNNKTTHHRRTSNTVTTSPQIIHCSPEHKESQTISHADDDGTDLSN